MLSIVKSMTLGELAKQAGITFKEAARIKIMYDSIYLSILAILYYLVT